MIAIVEKLIDLVQKSPKIAAVLAVVLGSVYLMFSPSPIKTAVCNIEATQRWLSDEGFSCLPKPLGAKTNIEKEIRNDEWRNISVWNEFDLKEKQLFVVVNGVSYRENEEIDTEYGKLKISTSSLGFRYRNKNLSSICIGENQKEDIDYHINVDNKTPFSGNMLLIGKGSKNCSPIRSDEVQLVESQIETEVEILGDLNFQWRAGEEFSANIFEESDVADVSNWRLVKIEGQTLGDSAKLFETEVGRLAVRQDGNLWLDKPSTNVSLCSLDTREKQLSFSASKAGRAKVSAMIKFTLNPPSSADYGVSTGVTLASFDGVDFMGDDLGTSHKENNASECRNTCIETKSCKAFTYDSTTKQCNMKTGVGTPLFNDRVTSILLQRGALKTELNLEVQGEFKRGQSVDAGRWNNFKNKSTRKVSNFQQCMESCLDEGTACRGVEYYGANPNKKCEIYIGRTADLNFDDPKQKESSSYRSIAIKFFAKPKTIVKPTEQVCR